jgi:hypothetical protein
LAPLIDSYLPEYQFVERHEIQVLAPREAIMAAVRGYDPASDPLIGRLIALRETPARIVGALRRRPTLPPRSFGLANFLLLEQDGCRELLYGLLGRFWRLDFGLVTVETAPAFKAFSEPRMAKLVLAFSTELAEGGAITLKTETRVFCPDRFSRARVAPYWFAIRLASGFIRRRMLASIKRDAEASTAAGPSKAVVDVGSNGPRRFV